MNNSCLLSSLSLASEFSFLYSNRRIPIRVCCVNTGCSLYSQPSHYIFLSG